MKYPHIINLFLLLLHLTGNAQSITAFAGATIIDGSGNTPVQNGVMLVQGGKIIALGPASAIAIPENSLVKNFHGKTIIPGLINVHGHVSEEDFLSIYARYGITTVVSLGGEKKDLESLRAVHNPNITQRARFFMAGQVITGNTPQEAIAVVDSNHAMGVDFMKIRVDDQLGTALKMPEEIYQAIIKRSHQLGYKVATHMYSLEDAKKLLTAGSNLMAHSVRDKPVDEEFIRLIKEKDVAYCPTLTRELSTFVYEDTAVFFSDPFFTTEYGSEVTQPLKDPLRQEQVRNSQSAQTYKRQLPVAMKNLKTLFDHGVPIAFGTDSGIPTRFVGYFEHLEMKMMVDAGLTPMQVIVAATKNAAGYMGLKDLGTLTSGHWADFIVLDADPLVDIANTHKINTVYISGVAVKKKTK